MKVKLEDYSKEKDYCFIESSGELKLVRVEQVKKFIKENKIRDYKIYGAFDYLVINENDFYGAVFEHLCNFIEANGRKGISNKLNNNESNYKLEEAYIEWIKDNEAALTEYYEDKDIEVQVC